MQKNKALYITTTLPYVNADPHIGFALEIVQADTLARHRRLSGKEVFFSTGTDEHGQKIARVADEKGEERQAYVDHYAGQFNKLKGALDLSYDNFIRTTDTQHVQAAQHIWKLCEQAGDIYKKKYTGRYCVGCESFKTDSDLVDGMCPDHQKEPEEVEEENYFFRLSKYQEYLQDNLSQEGVVLPDWRRREALAFVEQGLEDLSISREKKRMDWGIAVPDDDEHVMYVWFDALTNYISTLGWPDDEKGNFKKYWEEGDTLQLAGKDQIRFQSIIWQAMLKSAGLSGTDTIFYHGFINFGGQKMSKSLGNVISPYELVARYGTDATRYILLRHIHPADDSDLTWEKMDEMYTANLVNGLGNLVARVLKMAESYDAFPDTLEEPAVSGSKALESFDFMGYMDEAWKIIGESDQTITDTEPFKLYKTDALAARAIVSELVNKLLIVAVRIAPAMPMTAAAIQKAIKEKKKPDNLFLRLEK